MAKTEFQKELSSYVPRHIRLGLPDGVEPSFVQKHDIVEEIPIVNEEKRIVSSVSKHVLYDPKDTIGKFKPSDFDIDLMQSAGVPLDVVNVRTPGLSMAQIAQNLAQLDNMEQVAAQIQAQNEERAAWFKTPEVKPTKTE